ncbi:MAG TPA: L-2-hydroxyglutarate oxidase [Blastocatellia bacterium]|nr:L-2-hydroxyglutarate oxidase [Blastocatellia bacterium]
MESSDVIIIGGGIVGVATAYNLSREHPSKKVIVLEKENLLAAHQTGRNSGVLHSGIYYKPGSLKAKTCREGKRALEEFCEREGVAYEICGKVIVAVDEKEIDRLQNLYERGRANGVRCQVIDRARLAELEPHAAGLRALHVPEAGIIDYKKVVQRLAEIVQERGGKVLTNTLVTGMRERGDRIIIDCEAASFEASYVVNCAGLHSDRVARMSGSDPKARIVPFRGEYFKLKPEATHLCRNLIYPAPDPRFPFLGVHFTRMINGSVECGPSAVLAFAREGYLKRDIRAADLLETLSYKGFIKLAARHWKMGLAEMWQSFSKAAFVKALRRIVPEVRAEHLESAPAGVRAQAVADDGSLLDDFAFEERPRVVNVINAPSPAATASLAIGRLVVERLATRF